MIITVHLVIIRYLWHQSSRSDIEKSSRIMRLDEREELHPQTELPEKIEEQLAEGSLTRV